MQDALVIAAKFDGDVHGETCRLAFYGRIISILNPANSQELQQMKVYKVRFFCTTGSLDLKSPCTSRSLFQYHLQMRVLRIGGGRPSPVCTRYTVNASHLPSSQ